MRCPFCEAEKDSLKVIDSRTCEGGKAIRRRRQCLRCGKRFTTYEKIEQHIKLTVIKRDGRRVPWDQKKIYLGLERACFKRPVAQEDLLRLVEEVEEDVFKHYDRELPSTVIGQMVTDRLRRLDQVAYVRFASVYKQFKTLEELVDEAKAVIDARRYEDPAQGSLFVDATANAAPSNGNGHEAAPARPPRRKGRGRGTGAMRSENAAAPTA
ncbi:MAG: transcriptional regulator NrdR [Tepidisphaeraceae bacterium]